MIVQRVVIRVTEAESWTVVGDDRSPVESFLTYLSALERSPNTRSGHVHDADPQVNCPFQRQTRDNESSRTAVGERATSGRQVVAKERDDAVAGVCCRVGLPTIWA